jgi:hypothetical protein
MSARTTVWLAPGGREIVALEPAGLWGGQPGQFTIRRIQTATGRVSAPIVASLPARKIPAAEADSIIGRLATRLVPGDPGQYRAKVKLPEHYPPFESAVISADGVLWLAQYANPRVHVVVDLAGTPLMRVQLPEAARLFAVSRTHAWGLLADPDGLPIIVRYRIQ